MNFVKAMLAFQDYAAREALSANEVMLFLALFRVMNDRFWPQGMQKITNNQLLAHTTFYGSKRDDTLREARKRLAERGLIAFEPGDRRSRQPSYAIRWEALGLESEAQKETAPEIAHEAAPDIAPKKQGKNAGKPLYNYSPVKGIINKNAKRERALPPFTPPSLEQVRAYCDTHGLRVNPLKFYDFYASNGWKVGRNPMEDWQASLRLWAAREQEGAGGKRVSAQLYTQRQYTQEELEGCAQSLIWEARKLCQ